MFVLNFFAFFFSSAFFVRSSKLFGQHSPIFFIRRSSAADFSILFACALLSVITGKVFFGCVMLFFLPIGTFLAQEIKNKLVINRVSAAKLTFVRLLILKMSSGESFRRAADYACEQMDQKTCQIFKTIVENCASGESRNNSSYRLHDIERLIFTGLEKKQDIRASLSVYRQKLETESKLKNKIKSASAQVYAQIFCLIFMYAAVLTYTIWQYGFWRYQKILFISSILIAAGLAWSVFIAKGFKWKM